MNLLKLLIQGHANNMDGKSKASWRCSCSKAKGCWWVNQSTQITDDLVCTPCKAAQKLNWTLSGQKQADFNQQATALGVNGKILSAGWIHKKTDSSTQNYHIVLSIAGVTLQEAHVMAWDFDVVAVLSEDYGTNQE